MTPEDAAKNATRLLKEGRADVVKLEGGSRVAAHVQQMAGAGIAVVGHIGLTPQTYTALGGYRCQGKTAAAAVELVKDAEALQAAGCIAIVLECIPDQLSQYITELLRVPTIGIGAGQ